MSDQPPAPRPTIVRSARRPNPVGPVAGSPAASPQRRPAIRTNRDPSDVSPAAGSPASYPNGIAPADDAKDEQQ